MELLNQLFYLFFGVIVLMIFLGTFFGQNLKTIQSQYLYWPIALSLMVISSFSFFFVSLSPSYFLSLANTAIAFSGGATILFIASWRNASYIPKLKFFWLAFAIFFGGYELLRIFASFDTRVYLMTVLIVSVKGCLLFAAGIHGFPDIRFQSNHLLGKHYLSRKFTPGHLEGNGDRFQSAGLYRHWQYSARAPLEEGGAQIF